MSADELPPPFDDSRWQEYVKERLPVGGWCQLDYPVLVEIVAGFQYRLLLAPIVRLRRFSESSVIVIGAKLTLKTGENESEGQCLLHHDELRAILDLYGTARECQHFSSVMPTQAALGTRGGMTIRSIVLHGQPTVVIQLPRSRDALLPSKTYDEFVEGLRSCLDFIHEHFS